MVKIRGMVFVLGVLMLSGCSAAGVSAEPVEVAASVAPAPVLTAAPAAEPGMDQFAVSLKNVEGLSTADVDAAADSAKSVCAQLEAGDAPGALNPIENGTVRANYDFVYVASVYYCESFSDSINEAISAAYDAGEFN